MTKSEIIEFINKKTLTQEQALEWKELMLRDADIHKLEVFYDKINAAEVDTFYIEIEPGIGGAEASIWAQDLMNMYIRYLSEIGAKYNVEDNTIHVNQKGLFARLEIETGIHRVQRIPATEKMGRLQTSTASVLVAPTVDKYNVQLENLDLKITSAKGKGPGGQNVNKRSNMIRIVDKKTNMQVRSDGRLKAQNLEDAKSKIIDVINQSLENDKKERDRTYKSVIKNKDRSQKIRTYSYKDNRITDHRFKVSVNTLDRVMAGKLSDLYNKIEKKEAD